MSVWISEFDPCSLIRRAAWLKHPVPSQASRVLNQKLARWLTLWAHLLRRPQISLTVSGVKTQSQPDVFAVCTSRCTVQDWTTYTIKLCVAAVLQSYISRAELFQLSERLFFFFFPSLQLLAVPLCSSLGPQLCSPHLLLSALLPTAPPPPTLWAKSLAFFYIFFFFIFLSPLSMMANFICCTFSPHAVQIFSAHFLLILC